jgi:membrane associated rhomboid family serine protease
MGRESRKAMEREADAFATARLMPLVDSSGVAYMAHIGGMIFGTVTARLFERPRPSAGPWNEQ